MDKYSENNTILTNKSFQCNICQTGFTRKYNLNRHYINTHEENKNPKEKIKIVQTIKCLHCHDNFLSMTSFKMHLRKKHMEKTDNIIRYKCSMCSSTFSNMYNLNLHCYKKHIILDVSETLN